MNSRYWSASLRIEILAMSTFWLRARVSSRSKRTFKAVHRHHQRLVVGEDRGGLRNSSKISIRPAGHAAPRPKAPAARPAGLPRPADRSGRRRRPDCASACSLRLSACPSNVFTSDATSLHFVHIAIAVKHQVAAREQGRLARTDKGPSSAFMERSSDINSPSNPISPRITSRMTLGLVVAGRCGSIELIDNMRGHRDRAVCQGCGR